MSPGRDIRGVEMAASFQPRLPNVEESLGQKRVARILGLHPRTVHRRRVTLPSLRPLERQRQEKLDRIWRELTELFTVDNATEWLDKPLPALSDRRPTEVMEEDGGLDQVLDVIERMKWGIPV